MKAKTLFGAAALALTASAASAQEKPWVLLGIDGHQGVITLRDTARDTDSRADEEGLPTFPTEAACQAALRHAIKKYSGLTHAEGNYGFHRCENLNHGWVQGR